MSIYLSSPCTHNEQKTSAGNLQSATSRKSCLDSDLHRRISPAAEHAFIHFMHATHDGRHAHTNPKRQREGVPC
jgi:hypothetical protein